jgi:hypothetical protein
VSYSQPHETRRPGLVTAAAYLMILVAVLEVVNVVANLATMGKVVDATRKAYAAAPNGDAIATGAQFLAIVGAVLGLLIAAGFVIAALFDLRGSNAARIVSWALSGIAVLCFGCGTIGVAAGGALTNLQRRSVNGVDVQEATRQINEATPAWLKPTSVTILVINLLASIVIIMLLALPASNAFFRPRPIDDSDLVYPAYPSPLAPGVPPPAAPQPAPPPPPPTDDTP